MKNRSLGVCAMLFLFALSAGGQTLEFSSEVFAVDENQGFVTVTVLKSGDAPGTITVKYATSDNPPGPSSARAAEDYSTSTGTLTFEPFETVKQFTVPILDNAVYEGWEIFYVTLSNPTGGAAVRTPSTAQVQIRENDDPPTVQFSSANYSAIEASGVATLTLTKTGPTDVDVTAYYKTQDGSATAPSDYTFTGDDLTASVVFGPAETEKQIEIPIRDNVFREPDETFEVFLPLLLGGNHGTLNSATVSIIDDDPQGVSPPARALNISTRAHVLNGQRIVIGGFTITGNDSKFVVLRGIGPSLIGNGVPSNAALLDPILQLRREDGSIVQINDDWKNDQLTRAQIEGTAYEPKDDREAVIVAQLPAGAYTVFLTGKGNATGIGLVEIYDSNRNSDTELANLSTRGYVGMENDVMIGGFILGAESGNTRIALRGLGPSLANFGLSGVLADPALDLVDSNGNLHARNDDWQSDPVSAAQLTAHGLALPNAKEPGLFISLPPGQFTVVMTGKFINVGLGLIEIYNLK